MPSGPMPREPKTGGPMPGGPKPEPGLLERTARGAGWVMAWRLGLRALGLISTLILVRLLAPADFGLIALATGFAQTIDGMMAIGADEAAIRERNATRDVYDTTFTLNLIRGLAIGCLVVAAAWPAADFFHEPRLGPVLLFVALMPVLDGLANSGAIDFRRDFAFQKEFAIMVLPKLGGIVAAIACAFIWQSYAAMLAGMGVTRTLRVVMSYVMHPYRPRLSLRAWRRLIGYSVWTWLLGLVVLARDRSDTLLLGRLLGPAPVGLYSVGAEIAALPTTELVEPLCRSAFSGFAAERREGKTGSGLFLRLLGLAALVTLPAGVGLSLVAAPLVLVALGPHWDAAAPVVQVLALAGTMTVFGQIGLNLMSAHALLGRLLAVAATGAILRIGLLIALIPDHGVLGAAWAAAASICVEQALTVGLALRRFGVGAGAALGVVWRPAIATAAMAWTVWAAGLGWAPIAPDAAPLALVAGVGVGAAVYAVVLLLAWVVSGCPEGAERDGLTALRRLNGRRR